MMGSKILQIGEVRLIGNISPSVVFVYWSDWVVHYDYTSAKSSSSLANSLTGCYNIKTNLLRILYNTEKFKNVDSSLIKNECIFRII